MAEISAYKLNVIILRKICAGDVEVEDNCSYVVEKESV
jgi:hypothetical protein